MIKIICSVTAKLLQNCEDLFHFYSHYFVDDSETRYSHSFPLFFPTICFILFVVRHCENRHMSWFGVENYQTRLAINFLTCACKCSCYSPPSFLQVKDSVHSDIPEKIVHDTVHVLFKQNVASRNVFRVLDTFKDSIGIKVISIWITVSRFLWNFSLKFGFVHFFAFHLRVSHPAFWNKTLMYRISHSSHLLTGTPISWKFKNKRNTCFVLLLVCLYSFSVISGWSGWFWAIFRCLPVRSL